MAPESKLLRHQLGEAPFSLRRSLLKASVPVCLVLSLYTAQTEARTEPASDSWSGISAPFLAQERPSPKSSLVLSSLSPPSLFFNSSPAGRWSNRIQLPIAQHPAVQRYIRFYKGQGRVTFEKSLERSRPLARMMTEILESYNVPADLISVVFVESNFKGQASYRGAVGYWQIMASTARSMGLRVDRWIDERRDPIRSTEAAARYLRRNYERFGSWPLALAAYNAGERPVESAIRRCRSDDFWEICKRGNLPRITRAYVPKVLAAVEIMRDLETHGFESFRDHPFHDYESLYVKAPLKLQQVAQWIDVPVSRLQSLNPSLRLNRLPPDGMVNLNLPSGARDKFEMAYQDYLRR